jgi:hypothetical protein
VDLAQAQAAGAFQLIRVCMIFHGVAYSR